MAGEYDAEVDRLRLECERSRCEVQTVVRRAGHTRADEATCTRCPLSLLLRPCFRRPPRRSLLPPRKGRSSTATTTSTRRIVDAHKKFWADTLGGTVIKVGTDKREIIRMTNVLIFMRAQEAKAGTKGSVHDHIGLSVPNVRQTLEKVKANGFRNITACRSAARDDGQGRHRRAGKRTGVGHRLRPGARRREGGTARDEGAGRARQASSHSFLRHAAGRDARLVREGVRRHRGPPGGTRISSPPTCRVSASTSPCRPRQRCRRRAGSSITSASR